MRLFLPPSPFDLVGRLVSAKRFIRDSPLAKDDCSAAKGEIGEVQDYDSLEGLYYVDFGSGAIACLPSEIQA